MAEFKLVSAKLTYTELNYLEKVMKKDFPDNERMPISMIKKAIYNKILYAYFLTDGNTNFGYIITESLKNSKIVYVHYLAVDENTRGKGLGSIILTELKKLSEDSIFLLEVEDPDFANGYEDMKIRKNRLEFYYKNGFKMIKDTKLNLFGANMRLMATKGIHVNDWNMFIKKVYYDVTGNILPTLFINVK